MAYSILSVTKMTASQLASYTGTEGMIVINTDTDSIHVLDGAVAGGYSLPNENTVQSYVNTQVSSIMASGGQILPGAATTAGSVVTWDGGAWQEDSSFAHTAYVDSEIASLKPSTPSGAGQALQWDGTQFVHVTMTGGSGGGVGNRSGEIADSAVRVIRNSKNHLGQSISSHPRIRNNQLFQNFPVLVPYSRLSSCLPTFILNDRILDGCNTAPNKQYWGNNNGRGYCHSNRR